MTSSSPAITASGADATVAPGRRPRQLVVCCDGTNNTLTGGVEDTNVLLLHEHLNAHPPRNGFERVLYYDPGVGSPGMVPPTDPVDWARRSWERISGLASGRGIYDNIGQAYLFLMRNWQGPEDRIYCFGFSRGAFTARCVAGMVNLFGIVGPEYEALLPTLIHIYFSLPEGPVGSVQQITRALHHAASKPGIAASEVGGHPEEVAVTRKTLADQVRQVFATADGADAWIHWVGVWDTVESVGLPGPLSRSNPSTATVRGKRIRHVRHALSLDEHRWTFEPRLYEEPDDIDDGGQTLRQRWFPGVHCDVGGGYHCREAGLSTETLRWMIDEVAADIDVPRLAADASPLKRHDALWDTPWWALAGMTLRDMQPRTSNGAPIAVHAGPVAAGTTADVWDRPRRVWPVVFACIAGALCLLASGLCFTSEHWYDPGALPRLARAAASASEFANRQLMTLRGAGHGFFAPGALPWQMSGQPGWAMFWDLGFIAAWGYLLSRIASRAFTWLAGTRGPRSEKPSWRWLGFMPLLAVGGDVLEDVSTWVALFLHWIGTDALAGASLWLGSVCSVAKFAGLLGCVPLVLVRVWIVFQGTRRSQMRRLTTAAGPD